MVMWEVSCEAKLFVAIGLNLTMNLGSLSDAVDTSFTTHCENGPGSCLRSTEDILFWEILH